MAKIIKRECPACGKTKKFRDDNKTCGCAGTNPFKKVEPVLKESNEVKGDVWEIKLPKSRIHTLEQLVAYFEIDVNVWEVERFIANKWDMGYKDNDGDAQVQELYQIKAFLRRRKSIVSLQEAIQEILSAAAQKAPAPRVIKKATGKKGGVLEINLTDHHFGKLAWQMETLSANYDVKIATQVFNRALDAILDRSPFATYEQIWFVVGNDLFNADDTEGRTTAGTQVESDLRHKKTWVTVRTLFIRAIEKLRYLGDKVLVIVVPGNHDYNSTWHFGDLLEAYFSKYADVEVDNSPSPRKYHRYGNTLIGYTHGNKTKGKNLPLLMTQEARKDFGETKFHEWHTGHTHQTRTEEFNGIRVRVLPALCPADKWHAEMGFVGNLRSSEAYVWDVVQGLIGIVIYTDDDDLIEHASAFPSAVQE